jgi:hypothetical protein
MGKNNTGVSISEMHMTSSKNSITSAKTKNKERQKILQPTISRAMHGLISFWIGSHSFSQLPSSKSICATLTIETSSVLFFRNCTVQYRMWRGKSKGFFMNVWQKKK